MSQKASDIKRKRADGKPTNVAKRTKKADGGCIGKSIRGEYGGVNLSNPSYVKYYKGLI